MEKNNNVVGILSADDIMNIYEVWHIPVDQGDLEDREDQKLHEYPKT